MKIEFYGRKETIDKVKKYVERYIKRLEFPVYEVHVFLRDIPRECINCIYFPCKEKCRAKEARHES